jgi:recombination protein RecT
MAENQLTTTGAGALTPAQQNITAFKKMVDGNYVQTQLKQVLKENAGTFATSLMEVYTNDKQLQTCEPKLVVQEAIKAASLKLPLNKQLGYGYVVVYNNWDKTTRTKIPTPTLVIGYKGYIQLAMRTGQYRNINADVVYEGELRQTDKLTGAIDLNGTKTSEKIVGYFAHFELINGFAKTLYMTVEEMANYALKFAPTFRPTKDKPAPKVDELIDTAQEQAQNGPVQGQVGWKGDFNAMAQKTVLRRLLSKYGFLSIEMMNALSDDEQPQFNAEAIRDEENHEARPVIDASQMVNNQPAVDAQAEEVKDEQPEDKPDF